MLLIGPSQSGKTWIKKLISHFSEINKTPLNSILYFHASNDSDIFTELLQKFNTAPHPEEHIPYMSFISITETAIPKIKEELQRLQSDAESNPNQQSVVIFDDLMFLLTGKVSSTSFLHDLAMKRCHHKQMNVIFVKI